MTDHGKWQDDAEAWQEHYAQAGPHEIPGMSPCICSRCQARRRPVTPCGPGCLCPSCTAERGQAALVESGWAEYDAELAAYKKRLAAALAGMEPASGKMMILPDPSNAPVYGVTGPSLSGGGPSRVRVSETSPGAWHPDPDGTHWLTTVMRGGTWSTDLTPVDPAGGGRIMIPQAPMPDCTCGQVQDTRWGYHKVSCPARRRLIEVTAAEAQAERERLGALAGREAADPPETPADAWWRELRAIGGSLTYRQLQARVPDQPPGLCTLCRLMPVVPGRAWCADCIEATGETGEPGSASAKDWPGPGPWPGKAVAKGRTREPARHGHLGMRTLVTLTGLGVMCVVLAMLGFTPLIIPGIVLLGCSLSIIFKGEWR